MFGRGKIKLEKKLLERASAFAIREGYSSVNEFITHVLEREISRSEASDESEAEVKKRLEGLGYIS